MNREAKQALITTLQKQLKDSQATFFVNYQGLSVKELQDFRRSVRRNGGLFQVAKARLIQHALNADNQKNLDPFCKGQIGIVFSKKEDYEMAKILHNFEKNNAKLKLVVGYSNDSVLTKEHILQLAQLPSREVLLAQIAGSMQEIVAKMARLLAALNEKREQEGM